MIHALLRRAAAVAVVLTTASVVSACGSGGGSDGGGTATRPVTDVVGTSVNVPAKPQRVVTLSELDLDTTLALSITPVGLTAGRGQKTAPHYLADRVANVPVVGQVTGPEMDKVIQAKPDLILAGQVSDQQVLTQLRAIAPTVVTYQQNTPWKQAVTTIGNALNQADATTALLSAYDTKVAATRTALGTHAQESVSVARWAGNSVTVLQQGVFVSDVLKDVGVTRPAEQAKPSQGHSTPISMEALGQIDADHLFIGTLDPSQTASLTTALQQPAFKELNAVKQGHVTTVDGSAWTSLGGPLAANAVLDQLKQAMA